MKQQKVNTNVTCLRTCVCACMDCMGNVFILFLCYFCFCVLFVEIEFWLQDMETKLTTEELGHDISSVDSLLKKQQLHEADIEAHKV